MWWLLPWIFFPKWENGILFQPKPGKFQRDSWHIPDWKVTPCTKHMCFIVCQVFRVLGFQWGSFGIMLCHWILLPKRLWRERKRGRNACNGKKSANSSGRKFWKFLHWKNPKVFMERDRISRKIKCGEGNKFILSLLHLYNQRINGAYNFNIYFYLNFIFIFVYRYWS